MDGQKKVSDYASLAYSLASCGGSVKSTYKIIPRGQGISIGSQSDDQYFSGFIATADRPAAALAVLGGLTDELVEKVADAYESMSLFDKSSAEIARQLLAVVFEADE